MKNTLFFRRALASLTAICLVFLPLGSLRAQSQAATLSAHDKSFITEAWQGGLAEIQTGELAMIKATSKEAKKLASRLVQDHKKANSHLKKLADAKGVTLPAEPNATAQATFKQLEKKQGAEFDKMFAKDAVKDHKKDISTFEQVAKNTKDNDVKAFAEKTLPVLKEHLSLAEAANGKK